MVAQHSDHNASGRYRHDTDVVGDGAVEKIDPMQLIMRRLTFDDILDAYATFARAVDTKALKVWTSSRIVVSSTASAVYSRTARRPRIAAWSSIGLSLPFDRPRGYPERV